MDNAVMEMTSSEIRLKNTQFVINEFYNGTRRALAVALGKEPNTVSRWFKRKAIGDASVRLIEDKHEYPRGWMDTPHPELWGGDIDLSVSDASTPKSNAEIIGGVDGWDDSTPLGSDDVELPYHSDVFFAAGNGHQAEEFPTDKKLRFSKITLKKAGVDINNALCVKTNGTSMEPMLPDGSVVGVDTSRTNIIDGKVYAIRHNDELRIKQLYKAPGGGIRLRSYNQSEFPDEHYSAEDAASISVIGYVFWYSALI
jgi:phage repressor protein C with HTH and peptisase S24 domain